jgi:hypothetical protein
MLLFFQHYSITEIKLLGILLDFICSIFGADFETPAILSGTVNEVRFIIPCLNIGK